MKHPKKRNTNSSLSSRPLAVKEEGQEYAVVTKLLGNRRVECFCFDGVTRIARIRGAMKKRPGTLVGVNDIVLIGLRDFQDGKADIMLLYNPAEVRQLKKMCEIPEALSDTTSVHVDEVVEFLHETKAGSDTDSSDNQLIDVDDI